MKLSCEQRVIELLHENIRENQQVNKQIICENQVLTQHLFVKDKLIQDLEVQIRTQKGDNKCIAAAYNDSIQDNQVLKQGIINKNKLIDSLNARIENIDKAVNNFEQGRFIPGTVEGLRAAIVKIQELELRNLNQSKELAILRSSEKVSSSTLREFEALKVENATLKKLLAKERDLKEMAYLDRDACRNASYKVQQRSRKSYTTQAPRG